jgi:hypothetical protein
VVSDDWRHIRASEITRRVLSRLARKGGGIILLHDIQPATAAALPNLLHELKVHGYRVVHVEPYHLRDWQPAPPVMARLGRAGRLRGFWTQAKLSPMGLRTGALGYSRSMLASPAPSGQEIGDLGLRPSLSGS